MKCHAILSIENQRDIVSIKMLDHNHILVFDLLSEQGTESIKDPTPTEARIWLSMRLIDILDQDKQYVFKIFEDRFSYLPKGTICDRSNVIREEPMGEVL